MEAVMARRRISASARLLVWILVLDSCLLSVLPQDVGAMVAPLTVGEGSARVADLERVQSVLESKLVQQRLADVGLTADEVNARVSRLSDAELHQLAMNLDGLLPGGDVGVGFLIAVVIVLIVIVAIYLSGYRIDITRQRS
jgi:hypothetical protein